jgi:hypothetical protein
MQIPRPIQTGKAPCYARFVAKYNRVMAWTVVEQGAMQRVRASTVLSTTRFFHAPVPWRFGRLNGFDADAMMQLQIVFKRFDGGPVHTALSINLYPFCTHETPSMSVR